MPDPPTNYKSETSTMRYSKTISVTIISHIYVDTALILRKFKPLAIQQFQLSSNEFRTYVLDIKDNSRFPTTDKNMGRFMDRMKILEKEIQGTVLSWCQILKELELWIFNI